MDNKMKTEGMKGMSYKKFVVMMLISFFIMYLVMFLNIDNISHYHTSTTRIYMALLMVAPMAVVMMGMMGRMYPSRKTNIGIIVVGAIVFIVTLIALRTQTPVGDGQYMKAMIPHHSSAIMVSKHATIKDPEVKKLSEQIIASQEKEITEMNQLIEKLSK
jgi:uncharacterized protein (DUF305 family)